MTTRTRRRVAAAGVTVLLALALVGPAAAVAQAAGTAAVQPPAKATYHPGRGAGPLSPNAPSPSPASVVGAIAVTIAAAGIVAVVLLSLDRRGTVQLQAAEGSGLSSGASPPAGAEDEKRKAA